ncbi:MAG: chromate efflux transporter [Candidatus Methylacidiphilales bacterium]
MREFWDIFLVFLRLGLTSFGGPVAHLGYFHAELVQRRGWLSEERYAELLALCHFLPGPASSQLGYSIGLQRGGALGGLAAWLGFTLPSAVLMTLGAVWWRMGIGAEIPGFWAGLKAAAVAVVAHALWQMSARLCRQRWQWPLIVASAVLLWIVPAAVTQMVVLVLCTWIGWVQRRPDTGSMPRLSSQGKTGLISGILLVLMLIGLPAWAQWSGRLELQTAADFFRAGTLVFGGGHVVLPWLEQSVLASERVTPEAFMAGYGMAQALPGPLFTFASYLGALLAPEGTWTVLFWSFGALVMIFLPGFLWLHLALPHWDRIRSFQGADQAMAGAHAAVAGLLLAALIDPVAKVGITGWVTAGVAAGSWILLSRSRVPVWAIVMLAGLSGWWLMP